MNDSQARLIDMIRKLIAHEQSARKIGSLAEATAFAERIQRIMLDHKIEMSQVETAEDGQREVVGEETHYTTTDKRPQRSRTDRCYNELFNVVIKAHFCECVTIVASNIIWVIGREEDRAIALEMFSYLLATMKRLAKEERRLRKAARRSVRNFRSSFCRGFTGAIWLRYARMRETDDQTTALVLRKSEEEVRAKADELHPGMFVAKKGKLDRVNKHALFAGIRHGHEASLATKVVTGAERVPLMLGEGAE